MKKKIDLSPNFNKKPRNLSKIKFVIFHYTGMQSEIESLNHLKSVHSKVSSHYLINRKGIVTQLVKDKFTAWHAGKSKWKNFKDLNEYSIGIELVNKGHEFGYEKFSKLQIKSLITLCKILKKKYRIKKENFLGHSDIAPQRKIDPGEKFPWKKLSSYGFGIWFPNNINNKKLPKKSVSQTLEAQFFSNLNKMGYRYFSLKKRQKKTDVFLIKTFKRKFFPKSATKNIDLKTLKISYFLANLKD